MAGPFEPPSYPFPRRGMMPQLPPTPMNVLGSLSASPFSRRYLGYTPPQPTQKPLVTAVATGLTGRRFTFQFDPIGTPYHVRPGVYMLVKRGVNGGWDVIYIGETDNFDRRLNRELVQHHRWESIRVEGATHIGTLYVPGALAVRETIEADLRRAYNPPCNRQ